MQSFQNKVAVVTGSSKGIGRHLALELCRRGARVVLNGRDPEALENTRNWLAQQGFTDTLAVPADVSQPEACKRLIDAAVDHYGCIDLFFNNAGLGQSKAVLEDASPESFRLMMDCNVLGPMYAVHYALPHLRRSRGGILFTGSVAGIHGLPGYAPYSASKMALTAVVEALRNELRGSGVYVGIAYVGLVQNDNGKKVIGPDGSMHVTTFPMSDNRESQEKTARRMLRMVEKRQFKRYFTGLGKLNMVMNRLSPGLVNWLLGKLAK